MRHSHHDAPDTGAGSETHTMSDTPTRVTRYRVERGTAAQPYESPAGTIVFRQLADDGTLATPHIASPSPYARIPDGVKLGDGSVLRVTVEVLTDEPAPVKVSDRWAASQGRRVVDHVLGTWYGDEGYARPDRWHLFTLGDIADLRAEAHAYVAELFAVADTIDPASAAVVADVRTEVDAWIDARCAEVGSRTDRRAKSKPPRMERGWSNDIVNGGGALIRNPYGQAIDAARGDR